MDFGNGVNFGRQAAMNAQNTVIYDGCKWDRVEHFAAEIPNSRMTIFGQAFVVKPIRLGYCTTLMIPP
ncbi:hypothetical protein T07_3188 [Trichinella nelsoni]|uniref:Uncharacterized protein n=1 Tax=Trichinella nelsoni TaxID=6336 RepID=A0A0V0RIY4_9BILA|nr:hypothetical protein T07_3188 [Trichinella nelsoni]